MLTQEYVKEIFHYCPNTGNLYWKEPKQGRRLNGVAGYKRPDGYIQVRVDKTLCLAHRIIWLYVYGYLPEHMVDHKDRDPSNNRLTNLRHVTRSCNLRNVGNPKDNKSGVKGVFWHKKWKSYQVIIVLNGKHKYIGCSKEFEEAVFLRYAVEQCIGWSNCDTNSPARQWLLERGLIKK